jgi:hypothetical protein
VEISFNALVTDKFSVRGSYAHNKSKFVETTPNLIPFITPPGFNSTLSYAAGEPGDRLPGSPEDQGTLYLRYEQPLPNGWNLALSYGFTAAGDVLTRAGGKGGGYTLPAYILHNISAEIYGEKWTATFFVDNLADTFVATGARDTLDWNQNVSDINGDPVYMRRFYVNVLAPRKVGLRFERRF